MTDAKRLSRDQAIDVLLTEHRALYELAAFRLSSLDRRVPAAGATLVAFLGSVPMLPLLSKIVLLAVIPASLIWFLRTTLSHARSFEDLLRRIEKIEREVNTRAGEALLTFQSSHPSRGRTVGGRTSFETVSAVVLASALLLGSSLALAADAFASLGPKSSVYAVYVAVIAGYLIALVLDWRTYHYRGD